MPRRPGGRESPRDGLDKNVRPQDDFFRHINGGWIARTQIPADRALYGSFVHLLEKSEADLRQIIEEAAADRMPPRALKPARSATCSPASWTKRVPTTWDSSRSPPT